MGSMTEQKSPAAAGTPTFGAWFAVRYGWRGFPIAILTIVEALYIAGNIAAAVLGKLNTFTLVVLVAHLALMAGIIVTIVRGYRRAVARAAGVPGTETTSGATPSIDTTGGTGASTGSGDAYVAPVISSGIDTNHSGKGHSDGHHSGNEGHSDSGGHGGDSGGGGGDGGGGGGGGD